MSTVAATPRLSRRSLAPFLSLVGGVLAIGGFLYPCLFVTVAETCRPRYCHFGVLRGDILSGWQIFSIYTHPDEPPFTRVIAYPYGLISLVPLALGGLMLLISLVSLWRRPPRQMSLAALSLTILGFIFLLYDSTLMVAELSGYIRITTISPPAQSGRALLYLAYLLMILGFARMLRRNNVIPAA